MTCEIWESEPQRRSELRDDLGMPLQARLIRARAKLPVHHPRHEPDEPIALGPIFICCGDDDE